MKKIEVLGTGCPKCKKLLENAERAGSRSQEEVEVKKVEEITKIMDFGVMMTPALAVDGKVVSSGKVLSEDEILKIISE